MTVRELTNILNSLEQDKEIMIELTKDTEIQDITDYQDKYYIIC